MAEQPSKSSAPLIGSQPPSPEVDDTTQAHDPANPKDQAVNNTPQGSQDRSISVPPALSGQPKEITNSAQILKPCGASNSVFGSGLAAPALQQASSGLFGQYRSSDLFGPNAVPLVPTTQLAPHLSYSGIFGGKTSGSNFFGGGTKPSIGSMNAGPLFGSGNAFEPKHNAAGGLFSNAGPKTTSMPDIRVPENRAINFGCDLLTLNVGEDEHVRTFRIHCDFLTARSNYLKDSVLNEPEQKTFHLPGINPRAFALYFQLLYTGQIPSKPNNAAYANHDEYALLCKLYIVAHMLKDTKAANSALNAIFATATESPKIPSSEHVWIVYAGTEGQCGARKMLVDFYTYEATGDWMRAQGEDAQGQGFPPEFWSELAMKLVEKRRVPDGRMARMNITEYHEQ